MKLLNQFDLKYKQCCTYCDGAPQKVNEQNEFIKISNLFGNSEK